MYKLRSVLCGSVCDEITCDTVLPFINTRIVSLTVSCILMCTIR